MLKMNSALQWLNIEQNRHVLYIGEISLCFYLVVYVSDVLFLSKL